MLASSAYFYPARPQYSIRPKFGNDTQTEIPTPFRNQAQMLEDIEAFSRPQHWASNEAQVKGEREIAQKTARFLETKPPLNNYTKSKAGPTTKYVEFEKGFYDHIQIGYDPQRDCRDLEYLLREEKKPGEHPAEEFIGPKEVGNTKGIHPIMFIKIKKTGGTTTVFDAERTIRTAIDSGDPNLAIETAKELIQLSLDCKTAVDKIH